MIETLVVKVPAPQTIQAATGNTTIVILVKPVEVITARVD